MPRSHRVKLGILSDYGTSPDNGAIPHTNAGQNHGICSKEHIVAEAASICHRHQPANRLCHAPKEQRHITGN